MPERKNLKPIPKFESEDEEREFWANHDSTDYVDWSRATRRTFSRLKPSTQTISLRLPASLMENLRMLANKRDVPYQSLLKVFLAERVTRGLQSSLGASGEATAREDPDGRARRRKGSGLPAYRPLAKKVPKKLYLERLPASDHAVRRPASKKARAVEGTQAKAIARAKEL